MINLTGASDNVILITGGTQSIAVYTEWSEVNTAPTPYTVTPGCTPFAAIVTALSTDIVGPPTTTARNVKVISILNQGTSAETITVTITDGTNTANLYPATSLPAGWTAFYTEECDWQLLNASGVPDN